MGAAGGVYMAGVYMSAVGKYQEGKEAKEAHDYNAQRAEEKAEFEEEQSRKRWKRLMGTQLALYAKAGVDIDSGSPLLVMSTQAAEAELEALNIRYAGENEAMIQRWYGKKAKAAGELAAWSTLLTGGGSAAGGARSSGGGETQKSGSSGGSRSGGDIDASESRSHYQYHRRDRRH